MQSNYAWLSTRLYAGNNHNISVQHTCSVNQIRFAYPLIVRPPQFGSRVATLFSCSSTSKAPPSLYNLPSATMYPIELAASDFRLLREENALCCSVVLACIPGPENGMITTQDNSLQEVNVHVYMNVNGGGILYKYYRCCLV